MKSLRLAALLLGIIALFPFHGQAQEKKTYTLAVIPQMPVSEVFERWTPFVKKLSQELNVEFKILPYNAISQFESDVFAGVPDFAYMNSLLALKAKGKGGYTPLIRDNNDLVGILVAKKGGPVTSVQDLQGKAIAFPAPNAFAASLYMRALLTEKEKVKFTPDYVKTHNNVYRNVVLDKAAAGGGVKRTLMKEPDDVKNQLTIIYETPPSASHPLSAHTRVPASFRNKVTETILKLANDKSNEKMFEKITIPDPVKADFDRDYVPIKKIEAMLEKYTEKE